MDPRHLGVDQRLLGFCAYCGAKPNTRDHVPSLILLDDPLPNDLPVVDACEECNLGFSLDEEYLACFLECVIAGSVDPKELSRDKVKRIMTEKKWLSSRIKESELFGPHREKNWEPELSRVYNVVIKLAKGHAAYELSQTQIRNPDSISILPLSEMTREWHEKFENAWGGNSEPWPEIGSRALMRAAGAKPYETDIGPWINVQQGRYRYGVEETQGVRGVRVRIVLAEYLGCLVEWFG